MNEIISGRKDEAEDQNSMALLLTFIKLDFLWIEKIKKVDICRVFVKYIKNNFARYQDFFYGWNKNYNIKLLSFFTYRVDHEI